MIKSKTKLDGTVVTLLILVGLVFLIIAVLAGPQRFEVIFEALKTTDDKLSLAQLIVSFLGFIGAISAFCFAIFQYQKSERWKRMEFIANEVKEFEAEPVVQNVLLMIDWGTRKINLFGVTEPKKTDFVIVTREMQWKALLPHILKQKYAEYQAVDRQSTRLNFTVEEAKIRDIYDVFLTRLDRFETFVKAKLIDAEELEPFINYWIEAITRTERKQSEKDAKWRFTLLTYINFYNYHGVKALLKNYGKDISADGEIYQELKNSIADKELADRLYESIKN